MRVFKQLNFNLKLDEWVLGLTGLAAIVIGILDFTPFINLTDALMLRILIVALGLLMEAVVVQTGRRTAEIKELREALGQIEIEFLEAQHSFPQRLVQSIVQVKRFVLDTNLNEERSRGFGDPQREYREIRDKRLSRGEIVFQRVEVIFNKATLEKVVHRLLEHQGQPFFIRCYAPPPRAIPVLHIMSFDDEHYYLGGYYPDMPPAEEPVLLIRHPKVAQFLRDYWNVLWSRAIPLNDDREIYWDEVKRIALHIGMSESEFEAMARQLREGIEQKRASYT